MEFKEGYPTDLTLYFDGSFYDFWRKRICIFMTSIDFNLWNIVENGFVLNIKVMKILHQALHENVYAKISKCLNAMDI